MPYKSEKIKIQGTEHDRRIKLTEEDKEEIRREYAEGKVGTRPLAARYGVSRKLIQFVVDPLKLEHAKELLKDRKADGRYKKSREEHAKEMREHRQYKQKLYKEGKII